MSDTAAISQREYERAVSQAMRRKQQVEELTAKLAEAEKKLTTLAAERDKAMADHTASIAERDQYRAKLETQPDELRTKVDELTGKLRARAHRDTFDTLAKSIVRQDGIDAAWDLLRWTAETDDVDETVMRKAITDLVGRQPFLGIPAGQAGNGSGAAGTLATTRAAGPGTGRGAQPTAHDPNEELERRYPNPGRLA